LCWWRGLCPWRLRLHLLFALTYLLHLCFQAFSHGELHLCYGFETTNRSFAFDIGAGSQIAHVLFSCQIF